MAEVLREWLDDEQSCRSHFLSPTNTTVFVGECRRLVSEVVALGGSRWTVQGMVDDPPDLAGIVGGLPAGSPVEVIRVPVRLEDRTATYLRLSQNSPARTPDPRARHALLSTVRSCRARREESRAAFEDRSAAELDAARAHGFRLVCNDPTRYWVGGEVPWATFRAMAEESFSIDPEEALELWRGTGHSPLGHSLFGLVDGAGELIRTLLLATWPWGLECTRGSLNREYSGRLDASTTRASSTILTLAVNALAVARYGPETFLYSEIDAADIESYAAAGFRISVPDIGSEHPLVHQNVIWADSPLGARDGNAHDAGPDLVVHPYRSSTLASSEPALVAALAGSAASLLSAPRARRRAATGPTAARPPAGRPEVPHVVRRRSPAPPRHPGTARRP